MRRPRCALRSGLRASTVSRGPAPTPTRRDVEDVQHPPPIQPSDRRAVPPWRWSSPCSAWPCGCSPPAPARAPRERTPPPASSRASATSTWRCSASPSTSACTPKSCATSRPMTPSGTRTRLNLAIAFIRAAEARPRAGPGRLLPLRAHAHGAAERQQLPARRRKVRQALPPRPPVPVLGRVQPRQRPRGPSRAPRRVPPRATTRRCCASATAARPSASTCSTRTTSAPRSATSPNSSTKSNACARSCPRSGACTTTPTSTACRAGAPISSCTLWAARCGSRRPAGS